MHVALDMLHAATYLSTLRKEEDSSTFLATYNAKFCCIVSCKNGVLHWQFFATCNATFVALHVAGKIASCNMALRVKGKLCFLLRDFVVLRFIPIHVLRLRGR